MLAFPAIVCASATLIEGNERRKKEKRGLRGKQLGREAAALNSASTGWGSAALFGFALLVTIISGQVHGYRSGPRAGAVCLAAVSTWYLRRSLGCGANQDNVDRTYRQAVCPASRGCRTYHWTRQLPVAPNSREKTPSTSQTTTTFEVFGQAIYALEAVGATPRGTIVIFAVS